MQTIFEKLSNPDAALYYTPAFRDFMEMNMADLRRASLENSRVFDVTEVDRNRADRDFSLLCCIANVPFHLHWITARINGLKSFSEYRPSMMDIYTIDMTKFHTLVLNYIDSQTMT